MDILFTETAYTSIPGLNIAFLFLLIAASIYLGWASSSENDEETLFVMACVAVAIMISTVFLAFNFITGGIYEKEYVYVNQADVTLEEILEYKVVADLGDVIKLERIK